MSCHPHRERLGELLTGALDGDEAAAVGAHLDTCDACQVELQALCALEHALTGPAGVVAAAGMGAGLSRGWIAAALAAAIALGALLGLPSEAPGTPRMVRGALEGHAPGDRLPSGTEWVARGPGLLALSDHVAIELTPGTRLRQVSAETVYLSRGEATFRVTPGRGGLAVETPRGRVTVLGTVFRVSIQEGSMHAQGKAGLAAAVAVAVTAGVVMFESSDGHAPARLEAGQALVASTEAVTTVDLAAAADAEQALGQLGQENARLAAERDRLLAREAELVARVAELEQARALPEAEPAPLEQPGPSASGRQGLSVEFGEHGALEVLHEADWVTLAGASRAMIMLMPELLRSLETGEEISTELRIQLGAENQKLLGMALAINGKLPTHATGNGEYTHPILMSNMIVEAVRQEGRPFSEAQLLDLARLGDDYERDWVRLQAGYGAETLALAKILDELELKQRFTERVRALLDPTQLAALGPESVRDRLQLDLFSPGLMLAAITAPVAASNVDDLRSRLVSAGASAWGLRDDELVGFEGLFDGLAGSLPVPVQASLAGFVTVSEALEAGRTQLALMEELLRVVPLEPGRRGQLRAAARLLLPRLTVPE